MGGPSFSRTPIRRKLRYASIFKARLRGRPAKRRSRIGGDNCLLPRVRPSSLERSLVVSGWQSVSARTRCSRTSICTDNSLGILLPILWRHRITQSPGASQRLQISSSYVTINCETTYARRHSDVYVAEKNEPCFMVAIGRMIVSGPAPFNPCSAQNATATLETVN